jgi:hypothetical protein
MKETRSTNQEILSNLFDNRREIMDFLKDMFDFFMQRKKYWLLPIILVLLLFGVLIVLTSGSAIAPFIYTLF